MKKNIIPKHRFQAVFGPTRPWLRLPPKRELSKEKKNHIQFIFLKISLSLLGFKPSATGHRIGYFFKFLFSPNAASASASQKDHSGNMECNALQRC